MIKFLILISVFFSFSLHSEVKAKPQTETATFAAGCFWGVEELKIVQEGSLVSAGGSNDATSIYQKHTEPSDDTHKEEPVITTQKTIDYNYLSNNLK